MITLEKRHLVILMEAGYIYVGMQRFDEARKVFEGLCVLAPNSEVPVVALGGVAFCQGKFDDAIRHYKRALEIDPESLFAKAYLGETLLFSGEKDEALKLLQAVRGMDPKGAAGNFATALLDAIDQGFIPKKETGGKRASAKAPIH